MDSEGPDQTARMRRLILALAVRICQKARFRMPRPVLVESILGRKCMPGKIMLDVM